MIELIIYGVLALVCFTIFGLSVQDMDMWKVLALSLVWPITLYWFILSVVVKVVPWKV